MNNKLKAWRIVVVEPCSTNIRSVLRKIGARDEFCAEAVGELRVIGDHIRRALPRVADGIVGAADAKIKIIGDKRPQIMLSENERLAI